MKRICVLVIVSIFILGCLFMYTRIVAWNMEIRRAELGITAPAPRMFDIGGISSQSLPADAPPYEKINVETGQRVKMGGITYKNAITYTGRNYMASYHNLNGKYTELTGYIGRIDNTNKFNCIFEFEGDGELIDIFEVKSKEIPRPVSIDVTDVRTLIIYAQPRNSNNKNAGVSYALADTILR